MKHFLIVIASLLLLSCGGNNPAPQNEDSGTITVLDDYSREVTVPANVQRIVSLSPAVTEILFDLGAGDRLVGRTDFCHYPDQVEQIASIGGITNLNVETVVSVKPDLVISGSMVPEKSVRQLSELGIPVVCVIEKKKYEGLYDNILTIASLVGCQDRANELVADLREQLKGIDTMGKYDYGMGIEMRLPSIYYVVGYGKGGDFSAGSDSYINDIIKYAGGKNVAGYVTGWSFSKEKLMDVNPDYILIRQEDMEDFCKTEPYCKLMAVRLGRVIPIESGMIDLQVPRNIDAIRLISDAIHK